MKQRVITAIIMIALLIPILIYGKLPFVILGIFLTLVATQEMIEMKEKSVKTPLEVKIFTMVATLMIVFSSFNLTTLSFTGTLSIGLGLVALFLFILLLAVVIHNFLCWFNISFHAISSILRIKSVSIYDSCCSSNRFRCLFCWA